MIHWLILGSSTLLTFGMIKYLQRRNLMFMLLGLPGTFFHELAHYMVSLFLLGDPRKLSIIPRRVSDNAWVLGYVESYNLRWWNQALVAVAPLLLFPAFLYFGKQFLEENSFLMLLLDGYILGNLLYGMTPSIPDLKMALQKPYSLIFPIIFVYILKSDPHLEILFSQLQDLFLIQ